MKALLTGASGFIGSHLAEALIRRGYDVTCLARKSSNLRWIEDLKLPQIVGDLDDVGALASRIRQFDYIFHLAGLTKARSEAEYFRVNAEGTKNLVTAAAGGSRLRRFLHLSSLAAVGPSSNGTPVSEETHPAPVSAYGRSKLEGERAVRDAKLPATIIRPPGVYGPRDADFFMMFKMINRGIVPYWGEGHYSLLHVDDLVLGILEAAEKREAEGETFFLAEEKIYSNNEISEAISSALCRKAVKVRLPRSILPLVGFIGQKIDKRGIINRDRICDFLYPHWTCSSGKAKATLGFEAKITLREGMKWTADWYRIHRWL